MLRNVFLILLIHLFILSCATTHSGPVADLKDQKIILSVQRNDDLSDKYYLFYEYTIENTSSDWKQAQVIDVDFEDEDTEVLSGENLAAWIEGAQLKLKKAQYNREILLGSMAAVGGVVALTGGSSNVKIAGAGVLLGATAVSTGTRISQAKKQASSGMKGSGGTVNVPQSHVFVPSKVAPESYIKRWIVVRAPKYKIEEVKNKIEERNEEWPLKAERGFYMKQKLTSKLVVDGQQEMGVGLEVQTHPRFEN